ncbi:hypothetical protein KUG47_11885 [Falsochrobactrum sp. TDYN1]|uniref:Uncharacterized protein n=1 Tax=Falsochrobactrum tianjinense TaxID=2706015 RepID=A0A949UVM2_9HYPH|nr:hypothetical protein [Falsochrobactrum sp. TDYN1]MBV2144193.1 hypothetical protein [Falsochrobactrum sp. TDYN1]
MASKELIALVAEAIIDNPPIETMTDDEIIIDWSPTAQAAISTIFTALQEPTEAMHSEGRTTVNYRDAWSAMLAASALGEQSE